jgi:signal transduction histidine kinase
MGMLAKLGRVFSSNRDYAVAQELGIDGRKVLTIHMVLSTVLLRQALGPRVGSIASVLLLALLVSLVVAALVSRVAVQPLARIGDLIDSIASGEASAAALAAGGREGSEVAVVESKLSLLGEQFRGAQADARELRSNIDQLLTRLEEAVFLFGRDDRLVMAGGSAERLLGAGRWEMMGRTLAEIFPAGSELGATLQGLVALRKNAKDHPAELHPPGREALRLLASVETVEEFPSRERVGTLITLREAEPRRQIESQIDVSTRLAAISRLTSGAAHEIKNPLNSIALHVEVLKGKLEEADLPLDEIEVISREITRLDRVVRSFLDFTRPVELDVHPFDLAGLVSELAALVRPDAESQKARVVIASSPESAPVRGDRDLLKQAVLNVMINGLQAMPEGGALTLSLDRAGNDWLLAIRDEGSGIPKGAQDKIFQLYFTTKGKGSGIGLAMTFRVIQLHGGTIEFVSEDGKGTEFRLQIPALAALPEPPHETSAAEVED